MKKIIEKKTKEVYSSKKAKVAHEKKESKATRIKEGELKKPSSGLTKRQKSTTVKAAKSGKDIGKKGKMFDVIASKAGGGEKGKRIAAAAMWKNKKRKG